MYKNRKYRTGTAALSRPGTASTSRAGTSWTTDNTTNTNTTAASTITNPPITSTPIEANVVEIVVPAAASRRSSVDDDLAEVPASQFVMPSRYISQRSIRMQSQLGATQLTPSSYFESVLQKCGIKLTARHSDHSYTITCDHMKFVNNLRKELKSHAKYPENVQSFLSGLSDAMKVQTQLTKLLSGCIISLPNSDVTKQSQESIMNDFLMIDFMQADIIEILLNKVKALCVQDTGMANMEIELILTQLKFVDHLTNGDMVCEKLFEILELAANDARQAIIRSLEDIIDLTRHNDVAKKLMELLPSDAELLTTTTIDTFGNMCLRSDTYATICEKIVRFIKSDAPVDLLPCFTKFILRFNHQNTEKLADIIKDLRSCLKWPQSDVPMTRVAIQKNQKEVFGCISQSLIRSKQLFDVWLKRIQAETGPAKPIDFVILLMMMTINDERSNYIENIIRRKLRAGTINVRLLEETVQFFPTILLDYSKILFELLDAFSHDKNAPISNFAGTAYRIVFGIENCDRKVLLSKLIGFVYERHAQANMLTDGCCSTATTPTTDITTNALMILTEINQKYPIEMKNNGLQILRILDGCNEFSLVQYRMVMNILCSLAFTQPPCEMLQDHIDMLIKKQVSSSIRNLKNRGIIGVVRLVDHMIWEPNSAHSEPEDLNQSYNTIEDLPTEVAKKAANYIELLLTSAQNCPHHLALGFDELSAVFLMRNRSPRTDAHHINKPFLIWLNDLIGNYFETTFVTDKLPESSSTLPLDFVRPLNRPEEFESATTDGEPPIVGINIAGCLLNPSANSLSSIQVLPSLLNLMRNLFSRVDGGILTQINALLGAPIVLPKIMLSPDNRDVDLFDELGDQRARQVLDMHFYTANYWRECVSAFVTQLDPLMRSKVLTRLTEVIELENNIRKITQTAPDDYVPPVCLFSSEKVVPKFKRPAAPAARKPVATSKKRKGTDRSAISQLNDESNDATQFSGQTAVRALATKKKTFTNMFALNASPNEYFRHLDPDVMLLFEEELILQYPLPPEKIGRALGLLEFKFLMEDLTSKMESIFGVHKYSAIGHHAGQNIPFPAPFISDLVQMLPKMFAFFNQLANRLKIIIDKAAAINADVKKIMYSEESNYIKCCFGLCLRLLAAQFTWPGYDDDANNELFKDSLCAIIGDKPLDPTEIGISNLALVALKGITANANVVLDLQSAIYMIDLSKTLIKYVEVDNAYDDYVSKICEIFLAKEWYASDGNEARGVECNMLLDKLLQGYFHEAKFSFIRKQLTWIANENRDASGKNDFLKTFPCFKKVNFPLLYRAIFTNVIDCLNRKLDKSNQNLGQLKVWESSCDIIDQLLALAKLIDASRVFTIFLKNTHTYLKMFLQHGMPTIEIVMRRDVERVSAFLKKLQNSTRFLHTLCCHSKNIKNTAIIVQIPLLRETIAQLVYKVKGALAANKCSSAFWMGNLKNKNIYGVEILSQTTSITGSNLTADDDNGDEDDEEQSNSGEAPNGVSGTRRSKRQSNRASATNVKKRKLYPGKNNLDDDEDDDDTTDNNDDEDTSRSRCF